VGQFWNVVALVVYSVMLAILAKNPAVVKDFFGGVSGLAGTALH
jgi:hypothetical protein